MIVHVPTPLHSYTSGRSRLEAEGGTLAEVLAHIEVTHPGFTFRIVDEQGRIRTHVKFFVGRVMVNRLDAKVGEGEDVHIVCALSGG